MKDTYATKQDLKNTIFLVSILYTFLYTSESFIALIHFIADRMTDRK